MEKLELKNLAPYLPYGLKIKTSKSQGGVVRLVKGIDISENFILASDYLDRASGDNYYPYTLSSCKPILRPISDLQNKELDFWIDFSNDLDELSTEYIIESLVNKTFYAKNIHFALKLYETLYKMHFDVFGLIDKGLAVSYSEIKND